MLDHVLAAAAFRARAATLVVATTGTTTLTATATGYSRSSGSFVTDGFIAGLEITPVGFTDTTPRIITGVQALTLTVVSPGSAQPSGGSRELKAVLPALRVWDYPLGLSKVADRHYVDFRFAPGANRLRTAPARGGLLGENGVVEFHWYAPLGAGPDALRKSAPKLAALFTAGTTLVLSDGTKVRCAGNPAAKAGQVLPIGDGTNVIVVTVSWAVDTRNAVAA